MRCFLLPEGGSWQKIIEKHWFSSTFTGKKSDRLPSMPTKFWHWSYRNKAASIKGSGTPHFRRQGENILTKQNKKMFYSLCNDSYFNWLSAALAKDLMKDLCRNNDEGILSFAPLVLWFVRPPPQTPTHTLAVPKKVAHCDPRFVGRMSLMMHKALAVFLTLNLPQT